MHIWNVRAAQPHSYNFYFELKREMSKQDIASSKGPQLTFTDEWKVCKSLSNIDKNNGPVTQYRNKNNFYLLSTIPFLSGFKQVTWNFSEKSHGKGAPDGVGGAVKRMADSSVNMGVDIQTPE